MSGPITVNLSTWHTYFTTYASNVTINGGNANYTIIDHGDNATITVGNGDQYIYAGGTGNVITIGSSPGGCGWYTDGDSDIYTGGNSFVFALGDGDVDVVGWGGNNFVSLMNGDQSVYLTGDNNFVSTLNGSDWVYATGANNTILLGTTTGNANNYNFVQTGGGAFVQTLAGQNDVYAAGNNNTIATGNGEQYIVARGTGNTIFIGDTPTASAYHCGYGWYRPESYIRTGAQATVVAGNGDVDVISTSGGDFIQVGDGNNEIYLLGCSTAGNDTVLLGNGNNLVFLAGAGNSVALGAGVNTIVAGTGCTDAFQVSATGGHTEIWNFKAGDELDLSQILAGETTGNTLADLAPYVSLSMHTEIVHCGWGYTTQIDTTILVHGLLGDATIELENYNAGSLEDFIAGNGACATSAFDSSHLAAFALSR